MDTESIAEFDKYTPDELSELYQKNPEHFNQLAKAVLNEACIGKNEEQTIRLRQLQWFVDGQLRKGKTPLQRMLIMENIFYSRLFGEDGELAHLMHSCQELLELISGNNRKPVLHVVKNSEKIRELHT